MQEFGTCIDVGASPCSHLLTVGPGADHCMSLSRRTQLTGPLEDEMN